MSFIDKTIFSIRSRCPDVKQEVDSRNVADDDRIFHTPFQTDAQLQEESPEQMLRKKRTAFCCKRSSTKSLPLEQASDRRSICFHYLATNVSPSSGGICG